MAKKEFTRKGLKKASIIPLRSQLPADLRDRIGTFEELGTFYINPSSWTESKSARWVKHEVPGLSDPHQQWISSGARTISFEALVTRDLAEGNAGNKLDNAVMCNPFGQASVIKRVGGIAAQIFNIEGLSLDDTIEARGKNPGEGQTITLDLNNKLNYYRSLTYPNLVVQENATLAAPYPVRLKVGTTFGQRTRSAKFVVNRVVIKITKQLPDLTPIEARVTFTLTELVDKVLSSDTNILTDSNG